MDYIIRKIKEPEYSILNDFLYEAIFIPEGIEAPPKEIINQPELRLYTENFGEHNGDCGFVAEVNGEIIGAVWVRIMNDYGHINDETPSFAISLYKQFRNNGIGTAMMRTMLSELKSSGYKQASLAVQKANYAVKMYKNVGFEIIDENNETMYAMGAISAVNAKVESRRVFILTANSFYIIIKKKQEPDP